MKPLFVETLWSEAAELDQHQVWSFHDFEAAAFKSAMKHTSGGYLKTKVNVMFDNGDRIEFRLDLAPHDTMGVRNHVEAYFSFAATEQGQAHYASDNTGARAFLETLRKIEFPAQAAA